MNRAQLRLLMIFVLIVLTGLQTANISAQNVSNNEIKSITLGIVAETNQKEIEEHFRDFVNYIARKLSLGSAMEGKIIIVPTVIDLAKMLEQKKVDFYMESPYRTYIINSVHGVANLLLRRWKGGLAEYQSLIFTSRNSGINRVQDLRGKLVVFEDPESTSGYFLPKLFLQRNGLKLADKSKGDTNVSAEETGYIFARSQEKLIEMVLGRSAAAGAFSDDDYARLNDKARSDVNILAQTERLPRHLVSVRNDLPPSLVGGLEQVLVNMHEDPEGRRILQKTDDTTKFDTLPGGEQGMRRRLLDTFYSPDKR